MRKSVLLIIFCLSSLSLFAQLPTSNIFVFDFNRDFGKDSIFLSTPKFLTNYNRTGYNNHPHFLNEEELMISSSTPGEIQPDLYTLNINANARTRVTETEPGEYSPRRMPDYFNFSAIRMEYLPSDTLIRLWQFPMDRSSNGRPVFADLYNVGYYAWLNSRDIILFKVQTPNQLIKTDIYSGREDIIAENVGRCFTPGSRGTLLYMKINPEGTTDIIKYDPRAYFDDQKHKKIVTGLRGSQDFAVLQDGTLVATSNSELFVFREGRDETWRKVADLSAYNIKGITRIAISPSETKIALVAQ